MKVKTRCPSCGCYTYLEISDEESIALAKIRKNNELLIKEIKKNVLFVNVVLIMDLL